MGLLGQPNKYHPKEGIGGAFRDLLSHTALHGPRLFAMMPRGLPGHIKALRTCFEMGATAGLSSSVKRISRERHCWTSQQWHPWKSYNYFQNTFLDKFADSRMGGGTM